MSKLIKRGGEEYKYDRRDGKAMAGLLTVASVLLDGVTRVREAMKFPNAKLASDAGTERWRDISYGWFGES